MAGAMGMFVCFMIFASIGHFELEKDNGNNKSAGYVMIIFACLFILAYATTWVCDMYNIKRRHGEQYLTSIKGPIVWALIAEIYPSRYRATAMGLA